MVCILGSGEKNIIGMSVAEMSIVKRKKDET